MCWVFFWFTSSSMFLLKLIFQGFIKISSKQREKNSIAICLLSSVVFLFEVIILISELNIRIEVFIETIKVSFSTTKSICMYRVGTVI